MSEPDVEQQDADLTDICVWDLPDDVRAELDAQWARIACFDHTDLEPTEAAWFDRLVLRPTRAEMIREMSERVCAHLMADLAAQAAH